MHNTMLCGAMFCLPNPIRLPSNRHNTRADQPLDMWTTMPPAKSIALILAWGLPRPFIQPSALQIMCANGKYTTNIQTALKSMTTLNLMRSAVAPMINAGVMMANIIWYIANTLWETQFA